jgi:hypothetical protein
MSTRRSLQRLLKHSEGLQQANRLNVEITDRKAETGKQSGSRLHLGTVQSV